MHLLPYLVMLSLLLSLTRALWIQLSLPRSRYLEGESYLVLVHTYMYLSLNLQRYHHSPFLQVGIYLHTQVVGWVARAHTTRTNPI